MRAEAEPASTSSYSSSSSSSNSGSVSDSSKSDSSNTTGTSSSMTKTSDCCCRSFDKDDSMEMKTGPLLPRRKLTVAHDQTIHDSASSPPTTSTSKVLGFAFYSFLIFTCVQACYAIQSHSSSLLADTAAMFVDAATYFFNMLAERIKSTMSPSSYRHHTMMDMDHGDAQGTHHRNTVIMLQHRIQLKKLYLELLPPLLSIVTLLYITLTVFLEDVVTLYKYYHHAHATTTISGKQDLVDEMDEEPNSKVMIVFACIALVIDLLNVSCFSRARATSDWNRIHHAPDPPCHDVSEDTDFLLETEQSPLLYRWDDPTWSAGTSERTTAAESTTSSCRSSASSASSSNSSSDDDDCKGFPLPVVVEQGPNRNDWNASPNLNMYSAWTHVFADTMRSSAILVAGSLSYFYPRHVSPVVSDAVAALLVSFTILLSCIPLIKGLHRTWHDICRLKSSQDPTLLLLFAKNDPYGTIGTIDIDRVENRGNDDDWMERGKSSCLE